MATQASVPILSERTDVHKSCKSLEAVVNLCNDYCEAAAAVVQLQKKLAKALREAAALKCTTEIAANALNGSAVVFETLSDIDNKFAKLADKECEGLSSEVRKWFKKLAKEEKAHDDRIAASNAKIKQAGLSYEKKARKSTRDAAEEHSRYIALLGALGPEMSQEKYNHTVFMTQRQSATTYSVAGSLARIADAEWLRSCEGVRRFAPTIGYLGEWRVLCEGGWTGARPPDLPDVDAQQPIGAQAFRPPSRAMETGERPPTNRFDSLASRNDNTSGQGLQESDGEHVALSKPSLSSRPTADLRPQRHTNSSDEHSRPPSSLGQNMMVEPDALTHEQRSERSDRSDRSPTSLASLAAFPAPPTHFPIPPVSTPTGHRAMPSLSAPPMSPGVASSPESSPRVPHAVPAGSRSTSINFPTLPRLSESPTQEEGSDKPDTSRKAEAPKELVTPAAYRPAPVEERIDEASRKDALRTNGTPEQPTVKPVQSTPTLDLSSSREFDYMQQISPSGRGTPPGGFTSPSLGSSTFRRGDYLGEKEMGMDRSSGPSSRSLDAIRNNKGMQRSDSANSNSSLVANMRTRYTHTTAPSSAPPRDVPKLPVSVSQIANRYQSTDSAPSTPIQRAISPPAENRALPLDLQPRPRMPDSGASTERVQASAAAGKREENMPQTRSLDEYQRRKQRLEELEELEFREREYELRQRERELEQRLRDMESERTRGASDGYASDTAPGRTAQSRQTPQGVPPQNRHSYNAANLVPPAAAMSRGQSASSLSLSQPPSPAAPPAEHAPYCGCHACSVAKYKYSEPPSPRDMRPPEPPITLRPEKPKGWMRRLSMPAVSNAFSLDSKKSAGIAGGPGVKYNATYTQEDGKLSRRSYEPNAPGNRSVTNLGRR